MGNQYFQFKQFTVQQAGSAMKVCTDACIQGAFTAAYIREQLPGASPVLDIGAGTGLLSLMLAQSGNGTIDAVELDAAAAQQAAENFAASPWSERLRVFHTDIAHFNPAQRYPFIITNPPFFDNDLQGPHQRRTAAMHTVTLGYEALLEAIIRLLAPGGSFSILLPRGGFDRFRRMAENEGFVLRKLLEVRQTTGHSPFRSIGIFGPAAEPQREELVIYNEQRQYTPAFVTLLKDYYLYL
ncbi:tRNA1(Val) (adenine(37)-N6)-methyltransferase [Chitinophaga lutea]|nr:methyltransferase [Chitinophaga lutea]